MGLNERDFLGDGWYGLEKSSEGILYRAASRIAKIDTPLSGLSTLVFLLSARPEHVGEPLKVTVSSGSESTSGFELHTNHWTTRSVDLTLEEGQPITIEAHNYWSPDKVYGNADLRALGILLSAVRITAE